jgi:hypothetical protein
MDTIITSPATTPVGLLMVIDELLVELTVAVVDDPRCAICAKTSLLPSTTASSNIAFEITLEKKAVERNVPMSIKN